MVRFLHRIFADIAGRKTMASAGEGIRSAEVTALAANWFYLFSHHALNHAAAVKGISGENCSPASWWYSVASRSAIATSVHSWA